MVRVHALGAKRGLTSGLAVVVIATALALYPMTAGSPAGGAVRAVRISASIRKAGLKGKRARAGKREEQPLWSHLPAVPLSPRAGAPEGDLRRELSKDPRFSGDVGSKLRWRCGKKHGPEGQTGHQHACGARRTRR